MPRDISPEMYESAIRAKEQVIRELAKQVHELKRRLVLAEQMRLAQLSDFAGQVKEMHEPGRN